MSETSARNSEQKQTISQIEKPARTISREFWQALLLTVALMLAATVIAIAVISFGGTRRTAVPLSEAPSVPAENAIPENVPPPGRRGTVAFVIDDAGNNLRELEPFLTFPGPLTIAVLPGLPYSAEAARQIRDAGKELFLHQPMEAAGGQPPGPGAIYTEMENDEVLELLARNLAEIGPVAGMNNHQGSKITADRQVMETVLAFCRDQGICFLDSRTTAESAAPAAAQSLGVTIGERNIFIDNEQDRPSMVRAISRGLALAGERGSAIMIGHTWSEELAFLLADLYQDLIDQGYTFATVSDLLDKPGSNGM